MSKIAISFFIIIANVIIAQPSLTEIKRNIFQDLNSSAHQNHLRLINEGMTEDVQNDFYAFDNWVEIDLRSKDGDYIVLDSANYHIHDDIMLFLQNGKLYYIYPEEVDRITVKDKTYGSYSKDRKGLGYYEILVEGKFQLLKKHKVVKERVQNHPLGISQSQHDFEYKLKSDYYYYNTHRKQLKSVPRKKKNLMKVFSRSKSKMLSFARKNRLNSKSEDHLIQLFSYYNQLTL